MTATLRGHNSWREMRRLLCCLVFLLLLAALWSPRAAAAAANDDDDDNQPVLELADGDARRSKAAAAVAAAAADAKYFQDNDPHVWRELDPEETCPRGSHVRLDMTTGKRYVKRDESAAMRLAKVLQGADEQVAARIAHLRTLTEDEFERGVAEIWNERQAILSGARNASERQRESANDDALNVTVLLRQAGDPSSSPEVRSQVLLLLNDIADDIDEALGEFAKVGGIETCVALLRGELSEFVLRDALLLLGTAIKSDNHMQTLALNAGALSAIAPLLSSPSDVVAIKAVYALGSLLRGSQAAQTAVVEHQPRLPQSILLLMMRDATRLKASNLVGDLLLEGDARLADLFKLGGLCDSVWDSNAHLQEQLALYCSS